MKKIIDGLLYDTETSEIIYTDEFKERTWYMTKNKNYFIFYRYGSIVPKSEIEVKEFLGIYDVDKYIELFGEVQDA